MTNILLLLKSCFSFLILTFFIIVVFIDIICIFLLFLHTSLGSSFLKKYFELLEPLQMWRTQRATSGCHNPEDTCRHFNTYFFKDGGLYQLSSDNLMWCNKTG